MARFTNGWVKLHRSILTGSLEHSPILRGLFVDLLLWATRFEQKKVLNGKYRTLPAGTVITSLKELAELSNCSKPTIKRRLKLLNDADVIRYEPETRGTVVTICNWDKYQGDDRESVTTMKHGRNTGVTRALHEVTHIEESKNIRREEEERIPSPTMLIRIWNTERGKELPSCRQVLTPTRRKLIEDHTPVLLQLAADLDTSLPKLFAELIRAARETPWLVGRAGDKNITTNFDTFLGKDQYLKIIEGKYGQTNQSTRSEFV